MAADSPPRSAPVAIIMGSRSDWPTMKHAADALDRLSPPPAPAPSFTEAEAYVWHTAPDRLEPVRRVSRVPLDQLVGIDRARDTLLANTLQFARGHAANNALLLERLQGVEDRRARFVSALVAVRSADDPEPLVALGRWHGVILAVMRGEGGFGSTGRH